MRWIQILYKNRWSFTTCYSLAWLSTQCQTLKSRLCILRATLPGKMFSSERRKVVSTKPISFFLLFFSCHLLIPCSPTHKLPFSDPSCVRTVFPPCTTSVSSPSLSLLHLVSKEFCLFFLSPLLCYLHPLCLLRRLLSFSGFQCLTSTFQSFVPEHCSLWLKMWGLIIQLIRWYVNFASASGPWPWGRKWGFKRTVDYIHEIAFSPAGVLL